MLDVEPERKKPSRILLVTEDNEMRRLLAGALKKEGYEVVECSDGPGLMRQISSSQYRAGLGDIQLVISDIERPWMTALQAVEHIREGIGAPPAIVIMPFADESIRMQAATLDIVSVFDKPLNIDGLLGRVRAILKVCSSAAT
jgi:DNA-binding response OmpR family regulator